MKLKNLFPKGKNAQYTGVGIAVFALIIAAFVGPRLLKKKEENQAANLPVVTGTTPLAPPAAGLPGSGMLNNLPNVEQAVDTLRMANVYRGRRGSRAYMGISPFKQKVLVS
jgi:hypothetical protein